MRREGAEGPSCVGGPNSHSRAGRTEASRRLARYPLIVRGMLDCEAVPAKSSPEFRAAAAELLLKTLYDAAVHLAHTALAQIQRCADLFHRELFVIVQNDD